MPHVDTANNVVEASRRGTAAGARKGSLGEGDSAQSTEVKASPARDLLVMVKHSKGTAAELYGELHRDQ